MEFSTFLPYLTEQENKRKQLLLKIYGARLLLFIALIALMSLFVGIFVLVEQSDKRTNIQIGKAIALFVMFLVYNAVMSRTISNLLKMANSKLLGNKRMIKAATAVLSVVGLFLAYHWAYLMLGGTFSTMLVVKWVLTGVIIISLGIKAKQMYDLQHDFTEHYKATVLPLIINKLDQKLTFNPKGEIAQVHFENAGVFPVYEKILYFGSNLVTGSFTRGSYMFSETTIKVYEKRKNRKGVESTFMLDLFGGLFYVAAFNQAFSGKTVIYSNKTRKNPSTLNADKISTMPNFADTQLVKPENLAFNEAFTVYSNNQTEAQKILTPTFTRLLLQFQQQLNHEITIAFLKNRVYIFIANEQRILEPYILKPLNTAEQFQPIIDVISGLIEIGEELNFNTRIWTTE